ncbi:MAG: POTRA domain-containing protein [Saprospiraceae bacterium]
MWKDNKHSLYFAFAIIISTSTTILSQNSHIIIRNIVISGNEKTSEKVIYKELDFKKGDTIPLESLSALMYKNNGRLESKKIFNKSNINIKNWDNATNEVDVYITLQENWFIYPYPILELADRNFNVWRKEHNYNFNRLNYGAGIKHINLSGMDDALAIKVHGGYSTKVDLSYEYPYLLKSWGLSTDFSLTNNNEFGYISQGNVLKFYKNENEQTLLKQLKASIAIHNRSSSTIFQRLSLGYIHAKLLDDFDITLNPNYFAPNKKSLSIFFLEYLLKIDRTTYPLYPIEGIRGELSLKHEGFKNEIQTSHAVLNLETFVPIVKNLFISNALRFKYNFQSKPIPFYLYKGIGYDNNSIMGYQLYVFESKDYFIVNNALTYKLLDKDFNMMSWVPRQFKTLNIKAFLSAKFDVGYANDPYYGHLNPLSNTLQYGYGLGFDIVPFNISTFSAIYGFNKLGEKSWYFSADLSF